jgi:serine/threonine protein kinase
MEAMNDQNELIAGRYRILRKLGSGAFGETYLTADQHTSGEFVVKVAHSEVAGEAASQFENEVRVLARIHHPNVATLIDYGVLSDGSSFLVLEHTNGEPLDAVIRKEKLSLTDSLTIAAAIARALNAVHNTGAVHRDVKPSNIIIPHYEGNLEFARAKLVDFGVLGRLNQSTQLTQSGQIFGTPYYMSPEQIMGKPQSPAADIWGLGAVLFHMIFGHPPFSQESDPENVVSTIVLPLTREISIPQTPRVPDEVRSFLLSCLSREVASRPASAADALSEIEKLSQIVKDKEDKQPPSSIARPSSHEEVIEKGLTGSVSRAVLPNASLYAAICIVLVGIALAVWQRTSQTAAILSGLMLASGGVGLGASVPKVFAKRKTQIELDASTVFLGSKSRPSLSQSLAIEVDQLIARVRRLDEKILAKTLAVMLREYESAVEAQNRQAALMNVAQLLEKLMIRLSPWYIRHEKLIALTLSLIGVLSGAASIYISILKMAKGQ